MIKKLGIFLVVVFVITGCSSSKKLTETLLSAPYEMISHKVEMKKTFYTITKYKENTAILEVVRDREGKIVAGLLLEEPGAFVILPGTDPIPVKAEYVTMIQDELHDVWSGVQPRFSFVPVFHE